MSMILKGGRLIDGTGATPIQKAVIVLNGVRIKQIGTEKEVALPKEAEVIDVSDCTLMPGLTDLHMHISAPNIEDYPTHAAAQSARLRMTPEARLFYTVKNVRKMLEAGFTTIKDAGDWTNVGDHMTSMMVALRDAIEEGIVPGPRLVVAGLTIATNSHRDGLFPMRPLGATGDGPWELRKIARRNLQLGADYLKTVASGGVGNVKDPIQRRSITQEELDAIVDEAHAFDKRVACHCHTPESIRMAVAAGVDTIEHSVYTNDDVIALLVNQHKILVPTLTHRRQESIDARKRAGAPDFVINKMLQIKEACFESFRKLHEAGVKMACGTDAGYEPPVGQSAVELALYVEGGMTAMEAILTATRNAAEAIGRSDELGTLEAGKLADIIAVKGNPLDDIRILLDKQNIKLVVKNGQVAVDRRRV